MDLTQLKKYCIDNDTEACRNIMRFINNSKHVNSILLSRLNAMVADTYTDILLDKTDQKHQYNNRHFSQIQPQLNTKVKHGASSNDSILSFSPLNSNEAFEKNDAVLNQNIETIKTKITAVNKSIETIKKEQIFLDNIPQEVLKDINDFITIVSDADKKLSNYLLDLHGVFKQENIDFFKTTAIDCQQLQNHLIRLIGFSWYTFIYHEFLNFWSTKHIIDIFKEIITTTPVMTASQFKTYLNYIRPFIIKYAKSINIPEDLLPFFEESIDTLIKTIDENLQHIPDIATIDIDYNLLFNFVAMTMDIDSFHSKLCKSAVDVFDKKLLSSSQNLLYMYFKTVITTLKDNDVDILEELSKISEMSDLHNFIGQLFDIALQNISDTTIIEHIEDKRAEYINYSNIVHHLCEYIIKKPDDENNDIPLPPPRPNTPPPPLPNNPPPLPNIPPPPLPKPNDNIVMNFSRDEHNGDYGKIIDAITKNNEYMKIIVGYFDQEIKKIVNEVSAKEKDPRLIFAGIQNTNLSKNILIEYQSKHMDLCTLSQAYVETYESSGDNKTQVHYIFVDKSTEKISMIQVSKYLCYNGSAYADELKNIVDNICNLYCNNYEINNFNILILSTYITLYLVNCIDALSYFVNESLNLNNENRNNMAIYALYMLINLSSTVLNDKIEEKGIRNSGVFFGINDNQNNTISKRCMYKNLARTFASINTNNNISDDTIKNFAKYTHLDYVLRNEGDSLYEAKDISMSTNLYTLFVPCDFTRRSNISNNDKFNVVISISEFYHKYVSELKSKYNVNNNDNDNDNNNDNNNDKASLPNYYKDLDQLLLIDSYEKIINDKDNTSAMQKHANNVIENLRKYFNPK